MLDTAATAAAELAARIAAEEEEARMAAAEAAAREAARLTAEEEAVRIAAEEAAPWAVRLQCVWRGRLGRCRRPLSPSPLPLTLPYNVSAKFREHPAVSYLPPQNGPHTGRRCSGTSSPGSCRQRGEVDLRAASTAGRSDAEPSAWRRRRTAKRPASPRCWRRRIAGGSARHCHSTLSLTAIVRHSLGVCTLVSVSLLSFLAK